MLDINADVLEEMKRMTCRTRELEGASKASLYDEFVTNLNATSVEHMFLHKNVLALANRTSLLSNQV
jgi:hypothetical protein